MAWLHSAWLKYIAAVLVITWACSLSAQTFKPEGSITLGYPRGLSLAGGVSLDTAVLAEVGVGTFLPPFPYWSISAACEVSVSDDAGIGVSLVKLGGFDKSFIKADDHFNLFVAYPTLSERSWFARGGASIIFPKVETTRSLWYPYFEFGFQF